MVRPKKIPVVPVIHVMKKLGSVGRKKFFLIIFFMVLAVLNEH